MSATTKPAAAALEAPLPPPEISTNELWKRARKGDKTILPRLRALIDRNPDLFEGIGVMREAEESLAKLSSGGDLLREEVLVREIRRVAGELAGEDASPAVRLLAHRAALCLHAVNRAENFVATAWDPASAIDLTMAQDEFLQRRLDGTHRRFLQSVKMLETVRRLARPGPAVAVSVAQSVTVEAPAAAPAAVELVGSKGADRLPAAPKGGTRGSRPPRN